MELEPYVTNFKLDQFVGGDEDYVKHVIQSFVDSAKVLKNSEPLNASKVDRYQVFLCYQIYNCIDSPFLKSDVLLTFSNFSRLCVADHLCRLQAHFPVSK